MLIETSNNAVCVRFRDSETDEIKKVSVSLAIRGCGRIKIDCEVQEDKLQDRVFWFTASELHALVAAAHLLEV